MFKIIISTILIITGVCTLLFWEAGSHGHLRFRPHMMEDWILSAIVFSCFGIPFIFILRRNNRTK